MNDQIQFLKLSEIVEPWIILRPVRMDSVAYALMRDSIRDAGFLNSISVRPKNGRYEIIDGLYRYNCAVELRLEAIPCIIKEGVSDRDVLAYQIQANAVRPETTHTEYARQLQRIFKSSAGMSFPELADLTKKDTQWLRDHLRLLDLTEEQQTWVDRGEIPVENGVWLAKIPQRFRYEYVDLARAMTVKEFRPIATGVIKQFREMVQQGRYDEKLMNHGIPQAYLRNISELRREIKQSTEAGLVIAAEKCQTMVDAWRAALKWVIHLDAKSVEKFQHDHKKREQARILREYGGKNDVA